MTSTILRTLRQLYQLIQFFSRFEIVGGQKSQLRKSKESCTFLAKKCCLPLARSNG